MAMTKYRELNMVKWVGVRPGHNGEQIVKSIRKTNGAEIIHTVSDDKILLLFAWTCSVHTDFAVKEGYLFVRNAADVTQYIIDRHGFRPTQQHDSNGLAHYIPIEIPEKYDICIYAEDANVFVDGWIHGIEVDD